MLVETKSEIEEENFTSLSAKHLATLHIRIMVSSLIFVISS